jgi:hypothetical protein
LQAHGVNYILLREETLCSWFHCSLADWLQRMHAEVVQTIPLNLRAATGPADWCLVKLK